MSVIYIMTGDGRQAACDEDRVHGLVRNQWLPLETYFWKEGMAEWRPLSELPPRRPSFIPERRTGRLPSRAGTAARFSPARSAAPVITAKTLPAPAFPDDQRVSRRREARGYRLEYGHEPWATFALTFLAISIGTGVMNLWIDYSYAQANPVFTGEIYFAVKRFVLLLHLAAFALSQLMFFVWLYRAMSNSNSLGSNRRFSPGWSIGYFFIPGLVLIRPYQVVQEIWKVSENPRGWMDRRESILIICWWGFWLANWILLRGAATLIERAVHRKSFTETMTFLHIIDINSILELVATFIIVAVITWRQKRLTRGAE